jgi:hypothetical protein
VSHALNRNSLGRGKCYETATKALVHSCRTGQSEKMTRLWIQGCLVQRIMFRDGLVLNLDDYNELVVSTPFHLTLPATDRDDEEVVLIDPKDVRNEERPLFDFSGATCTHAGWDEDGSLHLRFSDGHEVHAHSDEHHTAWELYGKHHGYAACLPHGEVRVVRHDLPEDESAER